MPRMRLPCTRLVCVSLVLAFISLTVAATNEENPKAPTSSHQLKFSVFSAAGISGSSEGFQTHGTLAQPTPIGVGTSEEIQLYAGFWKGWSTVIGVVDDLFPEIFRTVLLQNHPNPFRPSTLIRYAIGSTAPVEITVYDVRGRVVNRLVRETKPSGSHEVTWDGRDDLGRSVESGIYFYRMRVGNSSSVRKMVLVK